MAAVYATFLLVVAPIVVVVVRTVRADRVLNERLGGAWEATLRRRAARLASSLAESTSAAAAVAPAAERGAA